MNSSLKECLELSNISLFLYLSLSLSLSLSPSLKGIVSRRSSFAAGKKISLPRANGDAGRGVKTSELFKSLPQMLLDPILLAVKAARVRLRVCSRSGAKRAAALSRAVYPLFQRRNSLSCNFAQLLDR